MNLFVPLDVDYQMDRKVIAAGPLGECLFVRSLAASKRLMSDGRIDSEQLPALCLGLKGKPKIYADLLVSVGLWTEQPGGWIISSWLKRNSSAAAITEKAENKKAASIKANHERWHTGDDGKKSTSCPLCYPSRIRIGVQGGQRSESIETDPESEVEPESYPESETSSGSSSSILKLVGSEPDEDEVRRIQIIAEAYADLMWQRADQNGIHDPEAFVDGMIRKALKHRDIERCAQTSHSVQAIARAMVEARSHKLKDAS